MGWDWLEEALDAEAAPKDEELEAKMTSGFEEGDDLEEPPPDPAREGIDWVRDEHDRIVHPLQAQAKELLHRLLDDLKNAGHFRDCDDAALGDFVGHGMNLTAKLAGALGSVARGWEPDPGMTIARLKRILTIFNEGLTASDRVPAKYLSPDQLLHFRTGLFALREDILALIARLRGAD